MKKWDLELKPEQSDLDLWIKSILGAAAIFGMFFAVMLLSAALP